MLWWLGRYGFPHEALTQRLPKGLLEMSLRFGLGDIVTVIGEKI
jgi:hypothetical protein